MSDEDFVTAEECSERFQRILESSKRVELALFGEDRRGGISNDLSKVVMRLKSIESAIKKNHELNSEQENISVKRLAIYATVISTILTTIITAAVNIWMSDR